MFGGQNTLCDCAAATRLRTWRIEQVVRSNSCVFFLFFFYLFYLGPVLQNTKNDVALERLCLESHQPWWFDRKDHLCSDLRSRIISPSISCKTVRRLRFSFFCPPLLFVTLRSWSKVHFPLQLQSTAAKQTSAWRIAAAVRRINSGEDKSTVREQNPTWLQVFTPPDSLALSSTPDPPRTSLRSYILCLWTINQSCFSRAPATTNVRAPRSRYPRCSFGLGKSGLIGKVKERKKLELKATSAAKIETQLGWKERCVAFVMTWHFKPENDSI